ncbi:MAG: hypothetical protein NWR51_05165 [Akkermansiaceae bacterium]|nr:hypothetical protein [Akkermansiaceae bacterium]
MRLILLGSSIAPLRNFQRQFHERPQIIGQPLDISIISGLPQFTQKIGGQGGIVGSEFGGRELIRPPLALVTDDFRPFAYQPIT